VVCFTAYDCPPVLVCIGNIEGCLFSGALQGALYRPGHGRQCRCRWVGMFIVSLGFYTICLHARSSPRMHRCWPCRLLNPVAGVGGAQLLLAAFWLVSQLLLRQQRTYVLSKVGIYYSSGNDCFFLCKADDSMALQTPQVW
jgi:hypothetical protein